MSGIDIRRAQKITGWMTKTELAWLAAQAQTAKIIIECGSYQGRSTRVLADHCPGVVYAIDPWEGPCLREDGTPAPNDWKVWALFEAHLHDHITTGRVVPMRTTFAAAAPTLMERGVMADLVFIDGDHRQAAVADDLTVAETLVKPGGILAGHDYRNPTWPGVQTAVDARFAGAVQALDMIWWVRR